MKRMSTSILVLLLAGILAIPALANSHNNGPVTKKDCEEAGGNWINNRGEKQCIFVEVDWEIGPEDISIVFPEEDTSPPWDTSAVVQGEVSGSRIQRGTIGVRGTEESHSIDITYCAGAENGEELRELPSEVCERIMNWMLSEAR